MDNVAHGQPQDFDFWEFVSCSRCHLAFSADGVTAPTVPFWLTDCGHVLCNSHLNPDQSCPSCNAQRIEMMPLQKELPSPMSEWFCSIPFTLDALAQAAKFQQESLASSARYYRNKCAQYRSVAERMKQELIAGKALKKEVEVLRQENEQLRGGRGMHEPGQTINANGKRRIVDYRAGTSSPRSIHTPLGPSRITLPPDHDLPPALARMGGSDASSGGNAPRNHQQAQRGEQPGSNRFSQQYAYNPPQTPQMHIQQVLSHEQQAPLRHAARQAQNENQNQNHSDRRMMPPPPTPAHARQAQNVMQGQVQRVATPRIQEQDITGSSRLQAFTQHPRQTPQNSIGDVNMNANFDQAQQHSQSGDSGYLSAQGFGSSSLSQGMQAQPQSLGQSSRRFIPPTPSSGQRFFPPPATPSSGSRRFVASIPATSSATVSASTSASAAQVGASHHKRFIPAVPSTSTPRTAASTHAMSAMGMSGTTYAQPQAQRTAFHPSSAQHQNGFS